MGNCCVNRSNTAEADVSPVVQGVDDPASLSTQNAVQPSFPIEGPPSREQWFHRARQRHEDHQQAPPPVPSPILLTAPSYSGVDAGRHVQGQEQLPTSPTVTDPALMALQQFAVRIRERQSDAHRQGDDSARTANGEAQGGPENDELVRGLEAFVRMFVAGRRSGNDVMGQGGNSQGPRILGLPYVNGTQQRGGSGGAQRFRRGELDDFTFTQTFVGRRHGRPLPAASSCSPNQDFSPDVAAIGPPVEAEESAYVECCICLSEYEAGDTLRVLPCLHRFHSDCAEKWLCSSKGTCPICRECPRTLTARNQAAAFEQDLASPRRHVREEHEHSDETSDDDAASLMTTLRFARLPTSASHTAQVNHPLERVRPGRRVSIIEDVPVAPGQHGFRYRPRPRSLDASINLPRNPIAEDQREALDFFYHDEEGEEVGLTERVTSLSGLAMPSNDTQT